MNNLSDNLISLPLSADDRVLLWLTYRGLKPVSEITVNRYVKKGDSDIDSIAEWVKDAGLVYEKESDADNSWHVGKNREDVLESIKALPKFDYENELISGKLFGFPDESVKAYASNRHEDNGSIVWVGQRYTNEYLKDKDFTPYLFYSISAENIEEDSRVAQKWADTIKEEVPELAAQFEKVEAERREKEEKDYSDQE